MSKYRIRKCAESDDFEIEKDGEVRYRVRYVGAAEDGYVDLWECDCPAGRRGRDCKHLRWVFAMRDRWHHLYGDLDPGEWVSVEDLLQGKI